MSKQTVFRWMATSLTALATIAGLTVGTAAAEASLPGEWLYNVKRAVERVELASAPADTFVSPLPSPSPEPGQTPEANETPEAETLEAQEMPEINKTPEGEHTPEPKSTDDHGATSSPEPQFTDDHSGSNDSPSSPEPRSTKDSGGH
jgi:hypothetical protein